MNRQEGYYWVKYKGEFKIAKYSIFKLYETIKSHWFVCCDPTLLQDSDFEHINEVRIKQPGELPD
jgi:hypothetical protein